MANKKAPKSKSTDLLLHCKCEQCASWEFLYDGTRYYLVCATCEERQQIICAELTPHASFHWEKA